MSSFAFDLRIFSVVNGKKGDVSSEETALIKELREGNGEANIAIDETGNRNEPRKWSSFVDDMKEFSWKHKGNLFQLDVVGEERSLDDFFRFYFLDGEVQESKAHIRFDEFVGGSI